MQAECSFEKDTPSLHQEILFDPQTAGPLLFALPEEQAAPLVEALHAAGMAHAVRVGSVTAREKALVVFC